MSKQKDIVMLGDSLIARGDWPVLLGREDVANCGFGGDKAEDILARLDDVFAYSPKVCFLMCGINDLGVYMPDQAADGIEKVILAIRKKRIQPIILSTLYTNKEGWDNVNHRVWMLNVELKLFALANTIQFINLNKSMSYNSKLIKEYTKDGVHLSDEGYKIFAERIAKYIKEYCSYDNLYAS